MCANISWNKLRNLLFRVTYYKKRINLEIYHVISDGTGALQFLKTILYYYLLEAHKEELEGKILEVDYDASFSQQNSDSFDKHYDRKNSAKKSAKVIPAFTLNGRRIEAGYTSVIQGVVSVKSLLELSRKHNTSITIFLTSLMILAIRDEMKVSELKKPIVIHVPVNLRNYFPSATARNFFGMISVRYDFSKREGTLEDIISVVSDTFKTELTKDKLAARMNSLTSLEHNIGARLAPLPLKNFAMKMAKKITDRGETLVISNVGKITMPKEFDEYISLFDVFMSTSTTQLCLCSYGDNLSLSFTSVFANADIQRNFFRLLTKNNIAVEIRSNT